MYTFNINNDIDIFSMFISIIANCLQQIFRNKQKLCFVELINVRFKFEFINTFFYIFIKEFLSIFEIFIQNFDSENNDPDRVHQQT